MVKRNIICLAVMAVFLVMLCRFGRLTVKAADPAPLFEGKTTEDVLAVAASGLSVPYVWGGTSPDGWDCSGYVTWAGRQLGTDMGRNTGDILRYGQDRGAQAASGTGAGDFNRDYAAGIIKAGDVIVFLNSAGVDVHTGIVGGDYSIYHAWGEGAGAHWFVPANSSWCEGNGTVHCRFDKMWEVDGGHGKSYASYVVFRGVEDKGFLKLMKASSNPSVTDANNCYSLAGAEYGVYEDASLSVCAGTLTTDAGGNSNILSLKKGIYYVKECVAPKGYVLDGEVYTIEVKAKETSVLHVKDKPKYDCLGLSLKKLDQETGESAQGGGKLAEAEFTVRYYDNIEGNTEGDPKRIWIIRTKEEEEDGKVCYRACLKEEYRAEGSDDFYLDEDENAVLPVGTYSVEETKAPEGYLLEDVYFKPASGEDKIVGRYVSEVKETKDAAQLEGGNACLVSDKVIRGDIEGVKIGGKTHKRLAGVPFEITSVTTGESHVVVTDENGAFSTASSWSAHSQNTNQGAAKEDGIWFGACEANDARGALPYDRYMITELRCEANKAYELIPPFEVSVYRDAKVIGLGTLTDEEPEIPEMPDEKDIRIHTTASNKEDGTKTVLPDEKVTIVDLVTIEGLDPGRNYRLYGWEMEKVPAKELILEGKRVENAVEFTAEKENEQREIEFSFDASTLGGSDVVIFEELYDITEPGKPELVAVHKDIGNMDQTVAIEQDAGKTAVKRAPKTGDGNRGDLFVFILLLLLSCAAIFSCVTIMRKTK